MSAFDVAANGFSNKAHREKDISPLFVSLELSSPVPSKEYIRVVALTSLNDSDSVSRKVHNGRDSTASVKLNGGGSAEGGTVIRNDTSEIVELRNRANDAASTGALQGIFSLINEPMVRHDFALHIRGARMCRLLDTMLDTLTMQASTFCSSSEGDHDNKTRHRRTHGSNALPPVVIPHATRKGCEALFLYLDLITSRVPTTLSKPLRAPLEEFVQPWELMFLLNLCTGDVGSVAMNQQAFSGQGSNGKKNIVNVDGKVSYHAAILRGAPESLNLLLEVAMLSDFLLVESLRQLTCAFIASLALNVSSEEELLQLCGLQRLLTEEELDPLYVQFPFLRPDKTTD